MNVVEKKLNALMDYILADSQEEKEAALAQVRLLRFDKATGMLSIEEAIQNVLLRIGVPDSLQGHRSLVTAVRLVVEDPTYLQMLTKRLYPEVAAHDKTTWMSAERRMRHAVDEAFLRCDPDVMEEVFGSTISPSRGKPMLSEFISRIAAVVQQQVQ